MQITTTTESVTRIDADAVVISIRDGEPLSGPAAEINQASNGFLQRMIGAGEVAAGELSCTRLLGVPGVRAEVVVVVGLGSAKPSAGLAFRAAGTAAKVLAAKQRNRVANFLDLPPHAEAICGFHIGCVGQDLYRQQRKLFPISELVVSETARDDIPAGDILGKAMNLTRRLINAPAAEIYPESFADEARRMATERGLEFEEWDEHRLHQERCGALLAVAQGSVRPPRLIMLRHRGTSNDKPWLALVGKGVTFDSGGLSLKPSDAMFDMKCDMSGAATVLGAMSAIAQMRLPVNVVGLCGLVENMVSGNSYKLGDVLVARSGKTIEVHNTDAEGRLVLADVLKVAVERGAARIVDLATLTGACMVALGRNVAGGFTNHEDWYQQVANAAEEVGEPLWQLPMFAEYAELIKSPVADIKNVGDGRWGGAITAAKFLEEFVEGTPWVHIDIAGPAFAEKPNAWIDAGASGCFVRTLVRLAAQSARSLT
ncbi:MAG TPA: leucyl aminopeptidase [Pirellulaceae bacterium]|nr:leucyl aminopeptidase [Pirellulaceae bacterium]